MLVSLAWKNIWRNKKRSIIVIVSIMFGLWGGLFSGAVFMGMSESMIESAVNRDLGHIQIHKMNYARDKLIKNYIPYSNQILAELNQSIEVKAVSPRTLIYGMAASPASSFGVKIIGIDPQRAKEVTSIYEKIIDGDYFESDRKNQLIIGQKLAKRLNLKIRSKVVLSFEGLQEDIKYLACRVSGIYKTESAQFDETNVYLRQSDMLRALESEPIYHEIAIRLKSTDHISAFDAQLKSEYSSLQVQTWKELAPDLDFVAVMMQNFTYLFVAIILFALLFGITNTMLMSVMDRIHELGMLIAIGMKKIKVFTMILFETIFLSLTGGILGIAIGALSITYFKMNGFDLSAFSASLESFGSSAMLYPFLPTIMYLMLTIMIIVAANFAAMLPAWKATHLQPAEAIRTY
jgi:putative ABC transport system permease protein